MTNGVFGERNAAHAEGQRSVIRKGGEDGVRTAWPEQPDSVNQGRCDRRRFVSVKELD